MSQPVQPSPLPHSGMGFREFVSLVAAFMAVNALAIDTMLPALPQIGQDLGIVVDNDRQWVLTAYLLGFGMAQLVFGVLSDRFGRKSLMLGGLVVYAFFSIVAAFSSSFEMMVISRFLQGIGAAATRVIIVSVVRDCYSGSTMARVMSLSFIVFLGVPILAPSLGQIILLFAPWQFIFVLLAVFALALLVWAGLRLPETLMPEKRREISVRSTISGFGIVLRHPISIGYTLTAMLVMASLMAFLTSAQQVFTDAFGVGHLFGVLFGVIAIFMAVASFINSRIVERFGTRRVARVALVGFLIATSINLASALAGLQTITSFVAVHGVAMFFFGLSGPNLNALAMEPMGALAGTASSVQGFITSVGSVLLGFAIAQQFDGTAIPLQAGFCLAGLGTVAIFFFTSVRTRSMRSASS